MLAVYILHVRNDALLLVGRVFKQRYVTRHDHHRDMVRHLLIVYLAVCHDVVAVVYLQHFLGGSLIHHEVVAYLLRCQRTAVYAYVRHVHNTAISAAYAHLLEHGISVRTQKVHRTRRHTVNVQIRKLRVPHRTVVYHESHTVLLTRTEAGRNNTAVLRHKRD